MKTADHELLSGRGVSAVPITEVGMFQPLWELLAIPKGTVPLAIFGPVGYGLRSGILGTPARATQAAPPLLFGL